MRKGWGLYILVALLAGYDADAQSFSASDLQQPQKVAPVLKVKPAGRNAVSQAQKQNDQAENNSDIVAAFERTKAAVKEVKSEPSADDPLVHISRALAAPLQSEVMDDATDNDEDNIFIPEGELYRLDTPTKDGSVRGGQAFVEVDDKGRMKKVTKIFLFYDEFKITNYIAGAAGCDVRFNVLSNLDQKINQLDVKLVWPDMTTTLSFSDVAPNTQTYYNYSLLGDGCYNMDKAPNIIVNRCRVRGMTAAECANKLLWLSK